MSYYNSPYRCDPSRALEILRNRQRCSPPLSTPPKTHECLKLDAIEAATAEIASSRELTLEQQLAIWRPFR